VRECNVSMRFVFFFYCYLVGYTFFWDCRHCANHIFAFVFVFLLIKRMSEEVICLLDARKVESTFSLYDVIDFYTQKKNGEFIWKISKTTHLNRCLC
jgi:hypothetical protein